MIPASRARSFAAVRVHGHISEHGFDFPPEDIEWMVEVTTLVIELRWAERRLGEELAETARAA